MKNKTIRTTIGLITLLLLSEGCSKNFLDRMPTDKLDGNTLFANPMGVKVYMANLYGQLPIEDFKFYDRGWSYVEWMAPSVLTQAFLTDEAVHSQWDVVLNNGGNSWWDPGYKLVRDVNLLIDIIPTLGFTETEEKRMLGESAFIRAFAYYGLAKRYGGVPLIRESQVYDGDVEKLKVPRSTEQETWDFVLSECDIAIANLPDTWLGGERRATKWAAYALKSRAALHAASIAKHWSRSPLSGPAADQGLVGVPATEANRYYEACIDASAAIMESGMFGLFKPNPANPQEAAENYRVLFEYPNAAGNEPIFIKGFARTGVDGHNYDVWYNPNQTANGWGYPGRLNPSLEFVDLYESYASPGHSAPIVTTEDGNVNDYNGYRKDRAYLRFENPYDIFKDKDARLWGTVILPGTEWKGENIIIQGGYVQPDGEAQIEIDNAITVDGTTYYSYGAPDWTQYSGFNPANIQMTRSGFSYKKMLSSQPVTPADRQSITDWMEFRYAEILLNYAEAVAESGFTANNAQVTAEQAINALRQRAGHTVDIPLTIESVIRERRVELAFENKRFWDLIRRREFHTLLNNTPRRALVPLLDLRTSPATYIFVRKTVSRTITRTFNPRHYYVSIPGIGANGLVQNPQY